MRGRGAPNGTKVTSCGKVCGKVDCFRTGDIRGGEDPVISGNLVVGWNCVTVNGGLKVCIDCVAMGDTNGNKDGGSGPSGGCVRRLGKVGGITVPELGIPNLKFGKPMTKLRQVISPGLSLTIRDNHITLL